MSFLRVELPPSPIVETALRRSTAGDSIWMPTVEQGRPASYQDRDDRGEITAQVACFLILRNTEQRTGKPLVTYGVILLGNRQFSSIIESSDSLFSLKRLQLASYPSKVL